MIVDDNKIEKRLTSGKNLSVYTMSSIILKEVLVLQRFLAPPTEYFPVNTARCYVEITLYRIVIKFQHQQVVEMLMPKSLLHHLRNKNIFGTE